MLGLITDRLSRSAAFLACIILVSMVLLILLEIILRSVFSSSTYVLDEFVGYGVAAMTFLSFSAALKGGVFIRVELVLGRLTPTPRRIVEVVSCLMGGALFSILTYHFGKLVFRNFDNYVVSNSIAAVPLWVPQSLVLVGLVLLILQFLSLAFHIALGAPFKGQDGVSGGGGHG